MGLICVFHLRFGLPLLLLCLVVTSVTYFTVISLSPLIQYDHTLTALFSRSCISDEVTSISSIMYHSSLYFHLSPENILNNWVQLLLIYFLVFQSVATFYLRVTECFQLCCFVIIDDNK
jgi:hypothetical protein